MRRILTGLIVLVAAASAQAAEFDWSKMGRNQFPAQVEAIIFEGGVMAPGSGRIITDMGVSFKEGVLPTARMTCIDGGACPNIQILELQCLSPGKAASTCRLNLAAGPGGKRCALDVGGKMRIVKCPTRLRLRK